MRLLRRRLRVVLVIALCLVLTVDPASACHWFGARWFNRCSPCASYCQPACYTVHSCAPSCGYTRSCDSGCWSGCESDVVTSSACGCGESVVDHSATVIEGSPTASHAEPTPTWSATEPATDRAVNKPAEDINPAPLLVDDAVAEPMPVPEAPVDDMVAPLDSGPIDEPVADDNMFAAPVDEPVAEAPAAVQPADNVAPANEPAPADDGLFGAPADEPPDDGLFGAPADEPAQEPVDDDGLFGAPADEPAADDGLFGAPAEGPAPEQAAHDGGLFGAPADDAAPGDDGLFGAPVEEAAPAEQVEDGLFGAPAEEAPMDDGLFGAPAEEPAPADDGLFGPADEPADDAPADDGEGDLFNFGSVLESPGGLSSLSLRHWVDNTGQYAVDARLIAVADGHVRLLKANGRTATVAFSRLSDEDLSFVNRQAAAERAKTLSRTAQR